MDAVDSAAIRTAKRAQSGIIAEKGCSRSLANIALTISDGLDPANISPPMWLSYP
jgi:hypothetical protein